MAELHSSHAEKGLKILAFPCNQFGKQEPGTNAQVKQFALDHGAKYDLFSKIEVNGDGAHPLYLFLQEKLEGPHGCPIKWNFAKFLCDKDGVPVKRFCPDENPKSCEPEILNLL